MIASWPTHCGKSQESTETEGMIVSHLYPAVRRPYVHEHDRFDSEPVGLKEHMIAGKFLDRGQARAFAQPEEECGQALGDVAGALPCRRGSMQSTDRLAASLAKQRNNGIEMAG